MSQEASSIFELAGPPKRVLLTGGTGFIGSHLARYLVEQGYQVSLLSRRSAPDPAGPEYLCSLTDSVAVARVFADIRPDYFLHIAALVRPGRDFSTLEEHYHESVLPAITLARVLPESLTLAIFFGSCEEYGNASPPFVEDQPLQCFSPYGWAKISAYYAVTALLRQRNIPFCWARPFLTFGPGQHGNHLIPSIITGCLRGAEIPLTPGEQTRDFIYVNDLCRMVGAILSQPDKARGEIINLCSGHVYTVREVAETLQRLIGSGKICLGALPYRTDEAMSFFGSPDKFIRLFSPVALTPWETALRQTIDSYRQEIVKSEYKTLKDSR